ncbi:VOC family protein [Bythopirellula polymerisocia]|uniref:VOC family protein n=1 Tax=Bythopirellula polymerisocia TaxID=2528003 RepID=UPI0018D292A2|nr:VOC family protein [Bythopirellula polymerisocia]
MRIQSVQPVLMVRDVAASIAFYGQIGFVLCFRDDATRPRYAGVRRDDIELHLQWHDAVEWEYPNDRPTYRFVVEDVDALLDELRKSEVVAMDTEARETTWGTYEFQMQDPDQNGLQFYRDL